MRLLRDFYFTVISFAILPRVVTASLDACEIAFGKDVVIHTSYKDGNRSCCKSIVCPAGFEAVLCSPSDPTSTSCRPCPPNTYQSYPTNSVDMEYCDAKRTCDVGMKIEDDDSSISDRRCLCDLEKGYCSPSRNRSMFCQRRSCLAGMELNQDCSCSECLYGFFKDVNGSMPCKQWRKCRDEGKKTVVPGTTTTDAVCNNSTYYSRTLTAPKAGISATLPGNVFTSDSPVHSEELPQYTSDPDHTAPENEHPPIWTLIGIATGIIAVMAVSICIIVCRKRRITQCKLKQPPVDCERQPILVNPLPADPTVKAEGYPPRLEVVQPLRTGDSDRDPRSQQGCCSDAEAETALAEGQTPRLVEDGFAPMTRVMTESLRTNSVGLLQSLVINSVFLSLLNINNTITNEMKDEIQKEKTSSRKTERLLDYLRRRPCLSYKTFIFALVFTEQSHLAQRINAELAQEYTTYINSGESPEEKVLSFGHL